MEDATVLLPAGQLLDQRVAFVGRLAGMPRREAAQLVRRCGATVLETPDESATLIIVGEHDLPLGEGAEPEIPLAVPLRRAADAGSLRIISETSLWQSLGLVESTQNVHRLYTPAMLADLLDVPLAVIRRWHRRGLIVPVEEVRRLPYFDFREVATARRLAQLLGAGCSPQVIERKLDELRRFLPHVERPLAQLSIIVEGKQLLLRQGDGLLEPGGQYRFDFDAATAPEQSAGQILPSDTLLPALLEDDWQLAEPLTVEQLVDAAEELDDEGELVAAAEMYRAALAAGGPHAEINFNLAELLYRLGEIDAARERYYMVIELDEDYVEARANLGCVLAETGRIELAVSAFRGALAFHPEYPDVHYHLARLLDAQGQSAAAQEHWQAFLNLAPDSPWAEEARQRLECRE